jgi:predicted dehydrogenase
MAKSPKSFQLGVVGCGGISQVHAEAIKRTKGRVHAVACCDVRREVATNWMQQHGCERCYTDYREMIRKEKLDAVLLATWPNQHREQIEQCLKLGMRKILCEKALALTSKEALNILAMVKRAKAFVMEGFMYRHNPVIRKMEQILSTGQLGPVDNVRACFSAFDAETASASDPNRDWRQRKELLCFPQLFGQKTA